MVIIILGRDGRVTINPYPPQTRFEFHKTFPYPSHTRLIYPIPVPIGTERGGWLDWPTKLPFLRPHRVIKQLTYLSNYHCYLVTHSFPTSFITSSTPHFLSHYYYYYFVKLSKLSQPYRTFVLAITSHIEPQTFSQVVKSQVWRDAMNIELQALESNENWSILSLSPGKHPVGCKWVYKIKFWVEGTMVVNGCSSYSTSPSNFLNLPIHQENFGPRYFLSI